MLFTSIEFFLYCIFLIICPRFKMVSFQTLTRLYTVIGILAMIISSDCFLQDVMRVIDHDRKLRNFMSTKTEDRSGILEQAIYKRQNKRMTNLLGSLKVEASKYEEIFSKIREVSQELSGVFCWTR